MGKQVIRVVAAVIERAGQYLITQRNERAVLPLLWEFPGGRVEAGESDEDALRREVKGRIGVKIVIHEKMGDHVHEYDAYDVHLAMFACSLEKGAVPVAAGVNDVRWVASSDLAEYEFPPADQRSMDKLLGLEVYER
jgi:8-oxo-dGTP diphosphatase